MACDINLNKEKSDTLKQTLCAMIEAAYSNQTIVDYLCAEVGLPDSNDQEYCLVKCVSSALFTYNPPVVYAKIDTCFPVFSSSSCTGGDQSKNGRGCSGKASENKAKQCCNVSNMYNSCNNYLLDYLSNLFGNMSIMCASYALGILYIAEHLAEITWADITKKIGASIDWIAKVWKNIKDFINSGINWSYTELESDSFVKALQDAMTIIQGFLSDIMKNAGQYIEQIADILYDYADRIYDLKEIAFHLRSLKEELMSIYYVIENTFTRQTEALTSELASKASTSINFDAQVSYTSEMEAAVKQLGETIETGQSNAQLYMGDIPIPTTQELENGAVNLGINAGFAGVSLS
jgi:hypothetical protein